MSLVALDLEIEAERLFEWKFTDTLKIRKRMKRKPTVICKIFNKSRFVPNCAHVEITVSPVVRIASVRNVWFLWTKILQKAKELWHVYFLNRETARTSTLNEENCRVQQSKNEYVMWTGKDSINGAT